LMKTISAVTLRGCNTHTGSQSGPLALQIPHVQLSLAVWDLEVGFYWLSKHRVEVLLAH
jgi:hypothetical protein